VIYHGCHGPQSGGIRRSRESIPPRLASFQTAIRKRYSDDQILAELRNSAERLGRSPTMKEFAADKGTQVHPQTVIETLRHVERREAGSGTRATPLRHARGAP